MRLASQGLVQNSSVSPQQKRVNFLEVQILSVGIKRSQSEKQDEDPKGVHD